MLFAWLALTGCPRQILSTPPVAATSTLDCEDREGYGPVSVREGTRYGEGVHQLSAIGSSAAQPIEVCGLRGELLWLLEATCDDGSYPNTDPDKTHNTRVGNVGPGGQCGSIVDLYHVKCREGTYEVYMDMYVCEEGESFM